MLKKGSIYWICQLTGWGMLFAMTMFFYFTLSTKGMKPMSEKVNMEAWRKNIGSET